MPIKEGPGRTAYQREWARQRRERNRELVRQYKVRHGCVDCGYNSHHAALEFDHIADNKYHNVATLMGQEKRLWEEIAKCEVVCGNCHNIRTWNRQRENIDELKKRASEVQNLPR